MPQPAIVDNEISHSILMPYENGDIARVTLSVYKAPKGQNRPIDAYVVTECEGDFTGAARRAAEAVYNLAQKRLPRIRQMVIGLDVQGLSPGSVPATGESCGLSFAIAIAGELFQKKVPVAATGVVSSSGNGKIDRVDGIKKKLIAAAESIPQEGRILYPADNHDEIPETAFKLARNKRITLHPVTSIAEAIYAAYGIEVEGEQTIDHSRLKKISAIVIVLMAITISSAIFLNNRHQKSMPPEQSFPENGTATTIIADQPDVKPSQARSIAEKGSKQSATIKSQNAEILNSLSSPPSETLLNHQAKNTPEANKKSDTSQSHTTSETLYPDSGFE